MNTTLNNQRLHKLLLFSLKVVPAIMAISYIMNVICADLILSWVFIFHYLGLVIAPILFMYIASYVFKFCNYHRCFLHFIAVEEILNLTDYYFGIPVNNETICNIHYINMLFFSVLFIFLYIRKRKQIKICKHEKV